MTLLTLAAVVGTLFATGTYLILRRRAIRLILGLALLTHGVNLLLFTSGKLGRGLPPIILDKKAFDGSISQYVDPLPQALILTAIVISFAVTAFTVVLVNRRQSLAQETQGGPNELPSIIALDPFASMEHYGSGLDDEPDDYEWLEFSLADELRARRAREQASAQFAAREEPIEEYSAEENSTQASDIDTDKDTLAEQFEPQDGDLSTSREFTSDSSKIDETDKDETNNTNGDGLT